MLTLDALPFPVLLEVISSNANLGYFPRLTRRRLTGYQQCQAWSSRSTHPFNRYPQYLFTSINMSAAVGAIPIHLHPAAHPLSKWTTLPQVWSSRSIQRIADKGKLALMPDRTPLKCVDPCRLMWSTITELGLIQTT